MSLVRLMLAPHVASAHKRHSLCYAFLIASMATAFSAASQPVNSHTQPIPAAHRRRRNLDLTHFGPIMPAPEQLRKRKVTEEDTLTENDPRPSGSSSRMSSAAATASVFEPSSLLSSSQNRQTMGAGAGATTPPGDYSLPSTDFGFDDLRDRMAKFTAKFDAFIEQGRKRVLEERNQFRINIAELQGRRKHPAIEGATES